MAAAVTVNLSEGQRVFFTDWVDTANVEHTGEPVPPGYAAPIWSADDGGVLVALPPGTPQGDSCPVRLLAPGTFNLTSRATKAGAPDMVGVTAVTIAGSLGSHLNNLLQPLS